jgi:hypothetical protein
MSKYFALLIPLLMACSSAPGTPPRTVHQVMLGLDAPRNPTDAETPYVSKMVARGTDGVNEWYCTDTDANPNLVWVECGFRNTWFPNVAGNSTDNSCIRVRFYEASTMLKVVESIKICSGPLKARQESTKYVAFENLPATDPRPVHRMDRSNITNNCGADFKKCVMLTVMIDE